MEKTTCLNPRTSKYVGVATHKNPIFTPICTYVYYSQNPKQVIWREANELSEPCKLTTL
jgi:hypothetical protein